MVGVSCRVQSSKFAGSIYIQVKTNYMFTASRSSKYTNAKRKMVVGIESE